VPAYSSGCCGSSKAGFFDRLKGRMGGGLFAKKSHGCGCAPAPSCAPAPCPAPCAPAPCAAPAPCHTCSKGIADRPNLFDTMKSRWGSKKHGKCDCGPTCDPCGAAHLIAPAPAPGGGTPPKEMPKPKDEPKKGGNVGGIPQPMPGPGFPTGASYSPY
jgi:hypothetical protein